MVKNNLIALIIHIGICLIFALISTSFSVLGIMPGTVLLLLANGLYLLAGYLFINPLAGEPLKRRILSVSSIFVIGILVWLIAFYYTLTSTYGIVMYLFFGWYNYSFIVPLMAIASEYGPRDTYQLLYYGVIIPALPCLILYWGASLRNNLKPLARGKNNKRIVFLAGVLLAAALTLSYSYYAQGNDSAAEAVKVGDWIYYKDDNDRFLTLRLHRLYKMRDDGTERTKICNDNPESINVVGDWIYYINKRDKDRIYRIQTDGMKREYINQIPTRKGRENVIKIHDNYLYFLEPKYTYIYKMDLGSRVLSDFSGEPATTIFISGDCLYYGDHRGGTGIVRKSIKQSSKEQLQSASGENITVNNGWLYYFFLDSNRRVGPTWRFRLDDPKQKQMLTRGQYIAVVDDWIYFVNEVKNNEVPRLYKMKLDGSEETLLSEDRVANPTIAGNWIFYNNLNENGKINRISLDGKVREKI